MLNSHKIQPFFKMFHSCSLLVITYFIFHTNTSESKVIISVQQEVENIVVNALKHKLDGFPQVSSKSLNNDENIQKMKLQRSLQTNYSICGAEVVVKNIFCFLAKEDNEQYDMTTYRSLHLICHEQTIHFQLEHENIDNYNFAMFRCPKIIDQYTKIYYVSRVDDKLNKMVVYVQYDDSRKIVAHRVVHINVNDLKKSIVELKFAEKKIKDLRNMSGEISSSVSKVFVKNSNVVHDPIGVQ